MKRDPLLFFLTIRCFFQNGKTYTKTVTYMPHGNLKATTVQTRVVLTTNDNILNLTEYLDDQQISKLTFDEKGTVTTNHFGFISSGKYYSKKSSEYNKSETIITTIKNKDTTNISKIIKCGNGSLIQISYKTKNGSNTMFPYSISNYSPEDSDKNILSHSSSSRGDVLLLERNQEVAVTDVTDVVVIGTDVTDIDNSTRILEKHFSSVKYINTCTMAPQVNLTSGLLQVGLKETIESKYDVNGKLVSKVQKISGVDGCLQSITFYNVDGSVVYTGADGSVLLGTWKLFKSPEYNNYDTIVSTVKGFSDPHKKNIMIINKSVLSPDNSRVDVSIKKETDGKWYVTGMSSHIISRLFSATNDIESRVKKIISEQLGIPLSDILNSSSFIDDLGADSLDVVELIMATEEEFGISIPDEEAEKIRTVQQLIDYVTSKV